MTDADSAIRQRLQDALDGAVADDVTPGAICEVTTAGASTITVTSGHAASFDGSGQPLTERREPVTDDTIYDLASVSKIFTSITLLSLADDGVVDLDVSIAEWLPSYRAREKSGVTLAHLLSHTSGLPSTNPHTLRRSVRDAGTSHATWVTPERTTVLDDILTLPLAGPTGAEKVYSCLGYITAMAVAEAATGQPWADLVPERVLRPLALTQTTFTPERARTAPTEYQPDIGRGMVHGMVHDETSCALGGTSGNAGLFAPARDVTALGSALLDGLPSVLSPSAFARLWDDQIPSLLGDATARVERELGYAQSLGLRIGQKSWMSAAGRNARGHTGFTGTSLLVDREAQLVVVLLTNRVHPDRGRSDVTALREAISTIAYEG